MEETWLSSPRSFLRSHVRSSEGIELLDAIKLISDNTLKFKQQLQQLNLPLSCSTDFNKLSIIYGQVQDLRDPDVYIYQYHHKSDGLLDTCILSDDIAVEAWNDINQDTCIYKDRATCYLIQSSEITAWASKIMQFCPSIEECETPAKVPKLEKSTSQSLAGMRGKFYGKETGLRMNGFYEFIGVPEIVCANDDVELPTTTLNGNVTNIEANEKSQEIIFHILNASEITNCNPLNFELKHNPGLEVNLLISSARERLMKALSLCLQGDLVVAELILLHIFSNVNTWADVLPIGKFCLNVQNSNSSTVRAISKFLEILLPSVKSFVMDVSSLNMTKVMPHKEVESDTMITGLLQMPDSTHLIIDETSMQPGQLNETGLRNLAALDNLVKWQKVEYCYQFQSVELNANIPVVVFSDSNSLLKSTDLNVKLHSPTSASWSLEDAFTSDDLKCMRLAICAGKSLLVDVKSNMTQFIQNDFVAERQRDPKYSQEDLHKLLNLSKIMSASFGETILTEDCWNRVKELLCAAAGRLH